MTSLGETYEKLMKFIRFFVNRAPGRTLPQWVYSNNSSNVFQVEQ